MTETNDPTPVEPVPDQPAEAAAPPPFEAASVPVAPPPEAMAAAPGAAPGYAPTATAPLGKIRGTGTCVLLTIVTLGFYTWYWYFKTSEEMKQHTGEGVGGPIALILAIFVGIVMPFVSPHEVGRLYERRGQERPVSATTGLWFLLLGWFFLVGCIVWFVKTNGALNDYWRSQGVTED